MSTTDRPATTDRFWGSQSQILSGCVMGSKHTRWKEKYITFNILKKEIKLFLSYEVRLTLFIYDILATEVLNSSWWRDRFIEPIYKSLSVVKKHILMHRNVTLPTVTGFWQTVFASDDCFFHVAMITRTTTHAVWSKQTVKKFWPCFLPAFFRQGLPQCPIMRCCWSGFITVHCILE